MKDIYFYIIRPTMILEKLIEKYNICLERIKMVKYIIEEHEYQIKFINERFYYYEKSINEERGFMVQIINQYEVEYLILFKKISNTILRISEIKETYFKEDIISFKPHQYEFTILTCRHRNEDIEKRIQRVKE